MQCIAHIVYGESGNEPIEGQFAVAWSVIFRAIVDQRDFGGSDYCNVAYRRQPGRWQYDGAKAQVRDKRTWETSVWVAEMVLQGEGKPAVPVMYFCAPPSCRNWHDKALDYVGTIGGHRFYTDRRFPEYQLVSDRY